jgi:hypothetical protein
MVAGRPHSGSSETMVRGPAPGARPHDTNQPLPVAVDCECLLALLRSLA